MLLRKALFLVPNCKLRGVCDKLIFASGEVALTPEMEEARTRKGMNGVIMIESCSLLEKRG